MTLENAWASYLQAATREFMAARDRAGDAYPHCTRGGRWELLSVERRSGPSGASYDHGNWTAGFWFGSMWILAVGSGCADVAALAGSRLHQLVPRADDATTHDLGFLFYPSVGLAVEAGFLDRAAASPALGAAHMLARRFNPHGDYLQAFGPICDAQFAGTSTIDTMMNVPLLWWARARGADTTVFDIARRHARTSARLYLRDDGSTYHLNRFDSTSGALLQRGTFQGAGEDSCWSRGQAWAVCGFAWAFAATGEVEFLRAAERAAHYYFAHLPESGIPPWDFADRSPDAPRDASASAITALGVLVLAHVHPDAGARRRFGSQGAELLASLSAQCLNEDDATDGILLHSCYSQPHGLGVDSAVAWGDFFLGLALGLAVGRIPLSVVLGFPTRDIEQRAVSRR